MDQGGKPLHQCDVDKLAVACCEPCDCDPPGLFGPRSETTISTTKATTKSKGQEHENEGGTKGARYLLNLNPMLFQRNVAIIYQPCILFIDV